MRESDSARNARIKQFLDDIFTSTTEEADRTERSENENGGRNNHQFISITAHSGAITSILEVIGHRGFQLQTGGVIPVFVRAERIPGREPKQVIDPPTGVPECKNDPLKAGGMGPMQVRETGVDV